MPRHEASCLGVAALRRAKGSVPANHPRRAYLVAENQAKAAAPAAWPVVASLTLIGTDGAV